jgi:RNA polymerase sigma factor (sigma-70 family)
MTNDELLAQFRTGSKEAFDALVARHIDWVYSAVLRQVHDAHLADDVTQTVFILLAKKAPLLGPGRALEPWLFKVARYASLEALRRERRRKAHEQKAAAMTQETTGAAVEPEWKAISPLLDDLVARLGGDDRKCILLRFYQRQTYPEIGIQLGISEEAARKRVDRAVEKLRGQFARQGVLTAAALLALSLTANTTHAAASTAVALCAAPASTGTVALANSTITAMSVAKVKAAAVLVATLLITGAVAVATTGAILSSRRTGALALASSGSLAETAVAVDAARGFDYLKGWPLALPGSVTGTPVVADLEHNGKLAILVPCEAQANVTLAHPAAGPSVLLLALHADGTPVPGWPVKLLDGKQRSQRSNTMLRGESWYSSPSVCSDANGNTFVVLTSPYLSGTRVISANGKIVQEFSGGRQWSNVPLVDLAGDGNMALIVGAATYHLDGSEVAGFPRASHELARDWNFGACIGDANGDGTCEIYNMKIGLELSAYDHLGMPLAGWPRKISCASEINGPHQHVPVMGDITGDGKMEIVVATEAIWAWSWDGKPLRRPDGVFQANISSPYTAPTLADLDGDGKAEVIIFDQNTRSVRAWHGDGRGVGNADGILAKLPLDCRGVSVADLGGDGIMDLFAGTFWIQFDPKRGKSAVIPMTSGNPYTVTQPTITDVDGDGIADIVFGLQDGRVFVYNTKLAYRPELVQWGTASGNAQHTGVWKRPLTSVQGR